jgi:hypothetical protein
MALVFMDVFLVGEDLPARRRGVTPQPDRKKPAETVV